MQFTFKGRTYELTDKWEETCLNDSKEFQLEQFEHLIKTRDYVTLENRVINQEKFGYLKQI
jgi:hypothetical protein